MNAQETQGAPSIEHLCQLSGVSRAGFYRYGEMPAPKRTEADLRDKIQTIALENRFYGYRRVCRDLADHLEAGLAIEALDMALTARNPAPGLIHHSDRGVQYACGAYGEKIEARGIRISMSRARNPYDNAKAERFMRTLKEEEVNGTRPEPISAPSSETSIIEADYIPRSATNLRLSSKPNSANMKPSERTQPSFCHSNAVSQPRGAVQTRTALPCPRRPRRLWLLRLPR